MEPGDEMELPEKIRAQAKELADYKAAYAASVGEELQRIAPGGTLLEPQPL
jgi:hypothetical protein